MCGKNCGTVPSLAWRVLGDGIDASVAITDLESHDAVESLRAGGVAGGPCGAAPLATLRKLSRDSTRKSTLGLGSESVLVLFCTEGARPYDVPGESSLQGPLGAWIYCATASRLRAKSLRWSKFFFFDDKLLLPFPFSYISAYQARFSILHQGFGFTRSSTSTLQSPASGNLPLLHQPTIYLFLAVSKVIVSPLALEAGIILNSIFRIMRVPSRLSEQQEVQSSFCHRDH